LCAPRKLVTLRSTPPNQIMLRCHLSTLMGRDKLRISDVARLTGLNRSTVTALYRETATRIELDAVERLCTLLHCEVGELFELMPKAQDPAESRRS
jgi:putative transcriptional regulator